MTPKTPKPTSPMLLLWPSSTRAGRVHSVTRAPEGAWKCNCEAAAHDTPCWALNQTRAVFPDTKEDTDD